MMFYSEELVGDYLIPQLVAIKCDCCQKPAITSEEMEGYNQYPTVTDSFVDLCPECSKFIADN